MGFVVVQLIDCVVCLCYRIFITLICLWCRFWEVAVSDDSIFGRTFHTALRLLMQTIFFLITMFIDSLAMRHIDRFSEVMNFEHAEKKHKLK